MTLDLFLLISIVLNLILIIIINKKKLKSFFYKSKIDEIEITKLSNIFELKSISENLKGPKDEAIIKSFSITPGNRVVGMTSDYEAWIIATISKISKNIFEFGTCSGKTTFLMGLNSPKNSKIISITLNPDNIMELKKNKKDNKVPFRNIINESIYQKFLFSGTSVEHKINVKFINSLNFDHSKYLNQMDLIFIDGGHTYSVIKSDSEKSFEMIKPNGIILWHDYVPGKKSAGDVVKYINEISKKKKITKIENTSLCFFRNE
jgi:predicted O-methyltransferase YrrM